MGGALTIGSTGSCLISEASAIDVSVSVFAPLARDERGAIFAILQP